MKKRKSIGLFIFLIFGFILLFLGWNWLKGHALLYQIYDMIGLVLFPSYIIMTIKIMRDRNKQGMNIFTRRIKPSNSEIIRSALQQIKIPQEIKNVKDGVLVKNQAGTFLIKILPGIGLLQGDLFNKEWHLKGKKIMNPFDIKADFYYLIYDQNMVYQVTGVEVVSLSKLVFKIENKILNTKEKK